MILFDVFAKVGEWLRKNERLSWFKQFYEKVRKLH